MTVIAGDTYAERAIAATLHIRVDTTPAKNAQGKSVSSKTNFAANK